jgi:thioredoxin 1
MLQEITQLSEISSGKVAIYFYGNVCYALQNNESLFLEISKKEYYSSIQFFKCDIEKASEIAKQYSIESIPSFLFLKDSIEQSRMSGHNINYLLSCANKLSEM